MNGEYFQYISIQNLFGKYLFLKPFPLYLCASASLNLMSNNTIIQGEQS